MNDLQSAIFSRPLARSQQQKRRQTKQTNKLRAIQINDSVVDHTIPFLGTPLTT